MTAGFVVAADPPAASLNGYTIIRAQDRDAVRDLRRNHSFLAEGSDGASTSTNCPASSTAEHSNGADAGPP